MVRMTLNFPDYDITWIQQNASKKGLSRTQYVRELIDLVRQYVLNINHSVYLVPFVRKDKNTIFLKTIFPHRKSTKKYLRGDSL